MPRFEPHPARRPAVITGASSGIGAATAIALATAGHPVALGARRTDKCEELVAAIRAGGGEAIALPLDVGDDDTVKSFAVTAAEQLGPVEILISCAGDAEVGLLHELDSAEFARQVQVNLVGAHRMVAAVVPGMVARQRGDVVFVSSDVVRAPRPRMGAYVPAKHGVDGVYDADPKYHPDAKRYTSLTYDEALAAGVRIMDTSAFVLANEQSLTMHVFDVGAVGVMRGICEGLELGTKISVKG